MYYRISKFKTNGQDSSKKRLNSLSTIRHYGKRHFAVVKPVPVLDPREVAFLHFTEIKTIDRKKSILGNRPKTQNKAFLEFLGEPANKSTAVVDPTCKSTGVAACGICPSPSESSIVSSDSESSTCQLTIEMEDGHQERSAKTPSYCYQPVTETIDMDCEPTVMDAVKRRTNLKRKAIVKKVLVVYNSFTAY